MYPARAGMSFPLSLCAKCDTTRDRRAVEQDTEMMRLQILGDPQLLSQLQQVRASSSFLPTLDQGLHALP